jgi:hypothetical protein
MPKLLPGIVGCTGSVVIASENSSPEEALVLKLRTELGQEVLLPLSERGAKQVQKVIGEFNRSRDLLFVDCRSNASVGLPACTRKTAPSKLSAPTAEMKC